MEQTKNSILKIFLEDALKKYNLEGKWNDYIAVQKEVLRVLRGEGFFEDNIVTNLESGMQVKVTTRGIRETFGNGKRFNNLPRTIKQLKIASIIHIKELIQTGVLIDDNKKISSCKDVE